MLENLDWNAGDYAEVSRPQQGWGRALVEGFPWLGNETVVDAGCGPGILTGEILRHVPQGRVVGVDSHPAMVSAARQRLAAFVNRAQVVEADIASWHPGETFDAVFSNAVFHWIADHDGLFHRIFGLLRPGGQLVAQWGGHGNIASVTQNAAAIIKQRAYAEAFENWSAPWRFDDEASTRRRLIAAGFEDVHVGLAPAPVPFSARNDFERFVRSAPLLPYLTKLRERRLQDAFVADFMAAFAERGQGWVLDYVRLTAKARRPQ